MGSARDTLFGWKQGRVDSSHRLYNVVLLIVVDAPYFFKDRCCCSGPRVEKYTIDRHGIAPRADVCFKCAGKLQAAVLTCAHMVCVREAALAWCDHEHRGKLPNIILQAHPVGDRVLRIPHEAIEASLQRRQSWPPLELKLLPCLTWAGWPSCRTP